MKEIKCENHAGIILVDDEDYDRLIEFRWLWAKGLICRGIPCSGKRKPIANEIMRQSGTIDHEDRNPFNNQKSNLRFCTQQQNCQNRTKIQNTSSKYKGVVYVKNRKKWRACITLNGNKIYLGSYILEEDAAKAYDRKAVELFKEFACLNFK